MAVSFQNADITLSLQDKVRLKKFISHSFESQTGKKLALTYVFCSDNYLLRMNQDFLHHDYYTDIITFPLASSPRKTEAEIYISIDRVRDNAAKLKVPFEQELYRVIFHGILHLLGYQDKTTTQKAAMRQAEDKWIRAFSENVQT